MTHIIVEGKLDAEIVALLLHDLSERRHFTIEAAGGRNAGRPLARRYLLVGGEPTAFVFDTDTSDAARVREEVQSLTDYFSWKSPAAPLHLVPMVPSLEVLFFDSPCVLERQLGAPLDEPIRTAGRFAPKQTLEWLLRSNGLGTEGTWIRTLQPSDVDECLADPRVSGLREFVESHSAPVRTRADVG